VRLVGDWRFTISRNEKKTINHLSRYSMEIEMYHNLIEDPSIIPLILSNIQLNNQLKLGNDFTFNSNNLYRNFPISYLLRFAWRNGIDFHLISFISFNELSLMKLSELVNYNKLKWIGYARRIGYPPSKLIASQWGE
jgi:hypothetical protein